MCCDNCGNDQFDRGVCVRCGSSPRIGPPEEDPPVFETKLEPLHCPTCRSEEFDGWDCKKCRYALPQKYRKMFPKRVTKEERRSLLEKLLKRLGSS